MELESTTTGGLRSRSRSKTPFLRSNCDGENCIEDEEHTHDNNKSSRKTPKRSTPVKQLGHTSSKITTETITETVEDYITPPVHRTRQYTRSALDKFAKTSDYSSEESLDRLKSHRKEIFQNQINSQYERVSTSSQRYGTLTDVTLSPIYTTHNVNDRSSRIGSPTYSACSTDSSFAEQALADTSTLLDRDPSGDHLPSRLYKMAGEYWNKYPKTDYTYSPLSKDRVELAPGQVAMPNMSRRSLSQFRVQGPNTSADEIDRQAATSAWTATTVRKRYTSVESSDDESGYIQGRVSMPRDQPWWITRLLVTILTTITTTSSNAYRRLVGPSHRYPYTDRRPQQASLVSRASSAAVAPFYWIYTLIKNTITTTVTTITETVTPNHVSESETYISRSYKEKTVRKRSWWPWMLLLLLPVVGYGSYYTYENWERLAMVNFTDFQLNLTEFTRMELPALSIPITITDIIPKLPDINITLPDIRDNLPEVTRTYREYKEIVQNRVVDASDYMQVVAESCFEEMRRFWRGIIG